MFQLKVMLIWKKAIATPESSEKNSEVRLRIELTTLKVLVRTLKPLSYWRLCLEQGRNLIYNYTSNL